MKITKLGPNIQEIQFTDRRMLVSYETVVAVKQEEHVYISKKYYSSTTSRHLSKWLKSLGDYIEHRVDPEYCPLFHLAINER